MSDNESEENDSVSVTSEYSVLNEVMEACRLSGDSPLSTDSPKVIFFDIGPVVYNNEPLVVHFRFVNYKPLITDRLALYKEGFHSCQDYLTYEWAPRTPNDSPEARTAAEAVKDGFSVYSVSFDVRNLVVNGHDLVEVAYICNDKHVGKSDSFYLRPGPCASPTVDWNGVTTVEEPDGVVLVSSNSTLQQGNASAYEMRIDKELAKNRRLEEELVGKESEQRMLKMDMEVMHKLNLQLKVENNRIKSENKDLESLLSATKDELEIEKTRALEFQMDLDATKLSNEDLNNKLTSASAHRDSMEEEMTKLQLELKNMTEELSACVEERDVARRRLDEMGTNEDSQCRSWRSRYESLFMENEALREDLETQSGRSASLVRQVRASTVELEELKATESCLRSQLTEIHEQLSVYKQRYDVIHNDNKALLNKIAGLEEQIDLLQTKTPNDYREPCSELDNTFHENEVAEARELFSDLAKSGVLDESENSVDALLQMMSPYHFVADALTRSTMPDELSNSEFVSAVQRAFTHENFEEFQELQPTLSPISTDKIKSANTVVVDGLHRCEEENKSADVKETGEAADDAKELIESADVTETRESVNFEDVDEPSIAEEEDESVSREIVVESGSHDTVSANLDLFNVSGTNELFNEMHSCARSEFRKRSSKPSMLTTIDETLNCICCSKSEVIPEEVLPQRTCRSSVFAQDPHGGSTASNEDAASVSSLGSVAAGVSSVSATESMIFNTAHNIDHVMYASQQMSWPCPTQAHNPFQTAPVFWPQSRPANPIGFFDSNAGTYVTGAVPMCAWPAVASVPSAGSYHTTPSVPSSTPVHAVPTSGTYNTAPSLLSSRPIHAVPSVHLTGSFLAPSVAHAGRVHSGLSHATPVPPREPNLLLASSVHAGYNSSFPGPFNTGSPLHLVNIQSGFSSSVPESTQVGSYNILPEMNVNRSSLNSNHCNLTEAESFFEEQPLHSEKNLNHQFEGRPKERPVADPELAELQQQMSVFSSFDSGTKTEELSDAAASSQDNPHAINTVTNDDEDTAGAVVVSNEVEVFDNTSESAAPNAVLCPASDSTVSGPSSVSPAVDAHNDSAVSGPNSFSFNTVPDSDIAAAAGNTTSLDIVAGDKSTYMDCPLCPMKFHRSLKDLLQEHVESHLHFVCPKCDTVFHEHAKQEFDGHISQCIDEQDPSRDTRQSRLDSSGPWTFLDSLSSRFIETD